MSEEIKRSIFSADLAISQAPSKAPDSEEEEELEEEEESSIEEDFRSLFSDVNKMKDRWTRLAKQREEEKDAVSAQVLRLIAGDIIPLISDLVALSGAGMSELQQALLEGGDSGTSLTEEEVVQIYVTLLSNAQAFKRMLEGPVEAAAKTALGNLVALNETTMEMLRENFGDEISEAAEEQLKEAAEA